ncbi:hypothetical protein [Neisseria musculi]|uniref:hypothetical protein n=1 Tax=Neisseria musculi TaxID=1815583 RepID=UPI00164C1A0A|nr:hypothetical protein [Neisseria musculi]
MIKLSGFLGWFISGSYSRVAGKRTSENHSNAAFVLPAFSDGLFFSDGLKPLQNSSGRLKYSIIVIPAQAEIQPQNHQVFYFNNL